MACLLLMWKILTFEKINLHGELIHDLLESREFLHEKLK